jgi:hypothetical protein
LFYGLAFFAGWAVAASVDAVQRYGFYRGLLGNSVAPAMGAAVHDWFHRFIYGTWPVVAVVALALMALACARGTRAGTPRPARWIQLFAGVGLVVAPAVGWWLRDRSAVSSADEMMHEMAIQLSVTAWTVVACVVAMVAWRGVAGRLREEEARLQADAARCVPTGGPVSPPQGA